MKKLFFSLPAFLVLFLIGCQENSVTDPNPDGSVYNTDKIPEEISGTIVLEGIMKIPGTLNTYLTIKGTIDYKEQLVFPENNSSPQRNYISVALSADGILNKFLLPDRSLYRTLWFISSKSEDQFYTITDEPYKFEKVYPIKGRTDNLALVCRFLVTENSVQLESKRLVYVVNGTYSSFSTL